MAIGADDVALGDFSEDRFLTGPADHLAYDVFLLARVSMVELHDKEGKDPAAVETWNRSQVREKLGVSLAIRGLS